MCLTLSEEWVGGGVAGKKEDMVGGEGVGTKIDIYNYKKIFFKKRSYNTGTKTVPITSSKYFQPVWIFEKKMENEYLFQHIPKN